MIAIISNIYLLNYYVHYLLKLFNQNENIFAYSFLFRLEMNKIQQIWLA